MKQILITLWALVGLTASAQPIPDKVMQRIYQEVRTPYKYGLVVAPQDNYHKIDCPTVFRVGDRWLMTYVVYNGKEGLDGRGYETWLASSDDLLHWQTEGRLLSYKDDGWDMNQRGGFPALVDWMWGGSYGIAQYKGNYWMTYIGGHGTGYEAVREPLNVGLAWTSGDVRRPHEWQSADKPLLSISDKDAQWWEQLTQYKSTVYEMKKVKGKVKNALPKELRKYRFIMFYNAGGVNPENNLKAERIGIALSNDLKEWKRYDQNPVYSHEAAGIITGDAQIVCMKQEARDKSNHTSHLLPLTSQFSPLYVMFYFSAYNPDRKYNAYNTFAVSRDLVHWQDWTGPDLIIPSKPYDEMFAHKSYVVKHDGVVYHFYCAVNNDQQRGIAVATSVPMGRSAVRFPAPERKGRRTLTALNDGWTARCNVGRDTVATTVNLPHNFDDYYGYRQLRHGNLHGEATYEKTFSAEKVEGKRYFLQFEGVGTYATVTLNGHRYPEELVGRTVWTLDVTDRLKQGENKLKVAVDHPAMQTASPWVCGGCSSEWGFSEGSQPFGIFRPVTLVETDAIRVEPFGVHIWNNAACDSVFIETEVKNYTRETQTVELVNKFTLASGKQVFRHAVSVTIEGGETVTLRHAEAIADAHRWSIEDPYLYTLATMLKRDGKTTDEVRTPFGIRSISWPVLRQARSKSNHISHLSPLTSQFSDNRFYLNGKPVFINGTCEYEHLLGQSHAFTPEQIRSRIKQISNAGFNALREAHQPHNLLYQQLCDEQGILFWSQFSAHIWYDTGKFRRNFKRLLERWVKERRNSPSVILWGLQNESVLPKQFAEECSDIIRRLDPTCLDQRAITTCNGGEGTDWNVIQNWSGTYGGSADNYDKELSSPSQLLNGEYGAWRTLDLHGDAKYSEENFTALLEKKALLAEKAFRDSLGVCGHFQWIFNTHDNPGRVQPDGALRRIDKIGPVNYKGLVTTWEEPTPAYYMYRQRSKKQEDGNENGNVKSNHISHLSSLTSQFPTAADRNRDLLKAAEGYHYFYRINCGGDAFTDEYGQQWLADDTLHSHSWGQDFEGINALQASQRHITTDIRGTKSDELFQFFRYGRHRLWYDLPAPSVASGASPSEYRIEIYFTEPWHGRDASETADYEGLRIFDVAVNGETVVDDLDPWAEAGYCGALKRVVYAKAKNGRLRISFPEVKAGQAVICGIAVAALSEGIALAPAALSALSVNWHALDTDTIAKLPKEALPKDAEARPATVYKPTHLSPLTSHLSVQKGTSFIITPGLGQEYALRFRYKNTTGQAVTARMTLTDAKGAVLVDRAVLFPPTPNKFKMLSTTTGTQINAGTYTLHIETEDVEFKELEVQ
ncbi:MAG: beta-galactosidase [Prevotella sp.]|nr:beta-galactosidase [Prevotella sp.]